MRTLRQIIDHTLSSYKHAVSESILHDDAAKACDLLHHFQRALKDHVENPVHQVKHLYVTSIFRSAGQGAEHCLPALLDDFQNFMKPHEPDYFDADAYFQDKRKKTYVSDLVIASLKDGRTESLNVLAKRGHCFGEAGVAAVRICHSQIQASTSEKENKDARRNCEKIVNYLAHTHVKSLAGAASCAVFEFDDLIMARKIDDCIEHAPYTLSLG